MTNWIDFVEQTSTELHAKILAARAAIPGENITEGPEFDAWVRRRNDARGWRLRNISSIVRRRGGDRTALNQAWDRGARIAQDATR